MLVLTRRIGEKLVIGRNIVVHVLQVQGERVRIGIEAPRDVSVNREEIERLVTAELGVPIVAEASCEP